MSKFDCGKELKWSTNRQAEEKIQWFQNVGFKNETEVKLLEENFLIVALTQSKRLNLTIQRAKPSWHLPAQS